MDNDIKSVTFTAYTPEGCWRQYDQARLTPGFDCAHYPEVDHFWLHEQNIHGDMEYKLVVVYGRDLFPNM